MMKSKSASKSKSVVIARWLPTFLTVLIAAAMLVHGPIHQPAHYHEFADDHALWGMPNAADVLSNIGFAFVGGWGLAIFWRQRHQPYLASAWSGYFLFAGALVLTAIGSGFYHWAPDNARLVWDRLPIALACAGLLAGMRAQMRSDAWRQSMMVTLSLALFGAASVGWWYYTEQITGHLTGQTGAGDLRPYLLLQGLPLLLIPIWQAHYAAPKADRLAFGFAILLYVLAKVAEVNDHAVLALLGFMSGHTLKHLLATAASAVIVWRMVRNAMGVIKK